MRRPKYVATEKALQAACMAYRLNGERVYPKDVISPHRIAVHSPQKPCTDPAYLATVQYLVNGKHNTKKYIPDNPMQRLVSRTLKIASKPKKVETFVLLETLDIKSNKNVMIDLLKNRLDWDFTAADAELMERLAEAVEYWTFDQITGKARLKYRNDFQYKVLEACSRAETDMRGLSFLAHAPRMAVRDLRRRDNEKRILDECTGFLYKVGDKVAAPMEVVAVSRKKKFAAVNGILLCNEQKKCGAWFFASVKSVQNLRRGDVLDVVGYVDKVVPARNIKLKKGLLKDVEFSVRERKTA